MRKKNNNNSTAAEILHKKQLTINLRVCFFGKIQEWMNSSIQKQIFCFLSTYKQISPRSLKLLLSIKGTEESLFRVDISSVALI